MAIVVAGAAVIALVGAGTVLADAGGWFGDNDNSWPYNAQGPAPVLAAVGDISCQAGPRLDNEKKTDTCDLGVGSTVRNQAQNATAEQVEAMQPALVAVLGDEQYQNGYYQDFEASFDKYWGAFKFLQRPAPGNHEFYDNHGQPGVRGLGYFDYYNGIQHNAANGSELDQTVTDPGTGDTITDPITTQPITQPTPQPDGQAGEFGQTGNGWYSYNLGRWHLISLNVECFDEPGGCSPTGSWFASETQWLEQDLNHDHAACTLAYWHQPTFSSTASPTTSDSKEGAAAGTWWQLLYQHHATLILNGHDHVYSRFAPMDPNGNADPHGIREFIVGTGGESLDTVTPSTPNLQAWEDQYYGVMKLTLRPDSYAWDFESAPDAPVPAGAPPSYSDSGQGQCMGGDDGDS
jgi:hypothetical protein